MGLSNPQSPDPVGTRIVTKVDQVVAPAVETAVLLAADIPPGAKRVTITNAGAEACRMKEAGGGGGIARGLPLAPIPTGGTVGQAMTIGTGGSLDLLDCFSTLGTTLAFFFERG